MLNSVFYTMGARLICALLMCGLPVVHRAGREAASPGPIETLRSVAALPPHLTGRFGEPAAFQQAPAGEYFVFDRRGHTVYAIDSEMTTARPVVRIGFETGRLLQPFAFQLGEGEFAGRDVEERPRVILLDLKLPKVSGIEVLRAVKTHERTRHIPVVVLTSSREDKDVIETYNLGVNSYVQKPVSFAEFSGAVAQLGMYWMLLNEPPPRADG